jgi:hypothetical protein
MVQIDLNKFYRERQAEMKELRDKGITLDGIAKKYEISRERVRQILLLEYPVRLSADLTPKTQRKGFSGKDKTTYSREFYRDNRKKAIEALGGICAKCGFTDYRALQIDHIYGGGVQEGKTLTSYTRHKNIRNNPELEKLKYQVLCANCNWIKREENQEHGRRFIRE